MADHVERLVSSIFGSEYSEDVSSVDKFIGDEAIDLLCRRLTASGAAGKKRLVLRGNCVGVKGARAISDLLRVRNALSFVSLEWNQIGSVGARAFAEALEANKGLTHLDLRNNAIDNDGAVALAQALRTNESLKVLDLRWNQIEDRGALAFKDALLERQPPVSVLLVGNMISEAAMKQIDDWTRSGRREPALDLSASMLVSTPPPPSPPAGELLSKEVISLRQQMQSLQAVLADVQRQLDGSALRVTELEQQLSREEYKNSNLTEALKQANLRLSLQNEEIKGMNAAWDNERNQIRADTTRLLREKDNEMREVVAEREAVKDKLVKAQDEVRRLTSQLEQMMEQSNADRTLHQNELRDTLAKLNEFAISESKLKTENSSLRTSNERNQDRVNLLASEMDALRREHERAMQEEVRRRNIDLDKIKGEYNALSAALMEKSTQQLKTIQDLQSEVSALSQKLNKQRMEMELALEEAAKTARQMEKDRYDAVIADLRHHLDGANSARWELEHKCDNLSKELKIVQDERLHAVQSLTGQLSASENEVQRQRSQALTLKNSLTSAEAETRARTTENDDLRKRAAALQDQIDAMQREQHHAAQQNLTLRDKVDKLEAQVRRVNELRNKEFSAISKSVVRAVERELSTLRDDLKLNELNN